MCAFFFPYIKEACVCVCVARARARLAAAGHTLGADLCGGSEHSLDRASLCTRLGTGLGQSSFGSGR